MTGYQSAVNGRMLNAKQSLIVLILSKLVRSYIAGYLYPTWSAAVPKKDYASRFSPKQSNMFKTLPFN